MAFEEETNPSSNAPAPDPKSAVPTSAGPTSDMPTGDTLQPPAEQPGPQPPIQLQPSKPAPGHFFKAISHSFAGALIGALAGEDPVTYSTDESGKTVATKVPQTNRSRLQRIAQAAMTGLAAGAQAPRRPGANALAGLGAGFTAEQAQLQSQDSQKRQQEKENWEQQQQLLTSKAIRAAHNASTFALHQKSQETANDHDPERQLNLSVKAGAEDFIKNNPGTSMTSKVISADQAHSMQKADAHTIGNYAFCIE